MTERILDHVGIAVASLDAALPTFEAITGTTPSGRETVAAQGVEVVFLGSGAGRIELLAPTHAGSTVARFLEKRGPGLHHLCYRVPDIAAALAEFAERGYALIDHTARPGAHGHQVAFLHPRGTAGVLVELVQSAH